MKPRLIKTSDSEKIRLRLWRASFAYWRNKNYYRIRRRKPMKGSRAANRQRRDAAVARARAMTRMRDPKVKRDIGEMISSLSAKERVALTANKHVIAAVEKIIEAMLFRFS